MISSEYNHLIGSLFEGVYIVDKNRKIIFWNAGSENITGYSKEEVVNQHCFSNILQHVDSDGKQLCFDGCPLHRTLITGDQLENEVFLKHKEGHRVPITVRTLPIYDDKQNIVAAIEVFNDNRYKLDVLNENKRLQQMVITDELTTIFNRRYLDFSLKKAIEESLEFNQPFGLLFVDIDFFKNVNDAYGHNVGDEILKLVARTINNNIRTKDVFGRWGGEEFLLIANRINLENLKNLAEKLRILVQNSHMVDELGRKIEVTISLGGTIFEPNDSAEILIKRSDANMYEAKKQGRNCSIIK